jgi:hypothetical protein
MRRFKLYRKQDKTGVSGCGYVASGETYSNGQTVLRWTTSATLADGTKRKIDVVSYFDTWQDVLLLHGHAGLTVLIWDDTVKEISDWDVLRLESSE